MSRGPHRRWGGPPEQIGYSGRVTQDGNAPRTDDDSGDPDLPKRTSLSARLSMPGYSASPQSAAAGGVTATPHTGSIPKIVTDDEALTVSLTTTGTHRAVPLRPRGVTSTSGAVPKVHKVHGKGRSRRRRAGWLPDQHGAWAMVIVPFWCGAFWSTIRPVTLVLFAFWFVGYLCFFAATLWLRSSRKERYWPPVRAYGITALVLGLITLLLEPTLLEWAVFFMPLIALAAWQAWVKRERSLLSRTVTVLASGLMCPVAYDLGSHFSRSGLPASWLQHSATEAALLPSADPAHAVLTGWPWILSVAFWLTAYFWATVPYVKTLVRERGSRGYLVFSAGAHALFTAGAFVAAAHGWIGWAVPVVWVLLLVRALALPLVSARRGTRIPVRYVGAGELVATILVVLAVNL